MVIKALPDPSYAAYQTDYDKLPTPTTTALAFQRIALPAIQLTQDESCHIAYS
ncbi:MAG: hypothetical protein R2788_04020 [Saprospiraceae bacterium]